MNIERRAEIVGYINNMTHKQLMRFAKILGLRGDFMKGDNGLSATDYLRSRVHTACADLPLEALEAKLLEAFPGGFNPKGRGYYRRGNYGHKASQEAVQAENDGGHDIQAKAENVGADISKKADVNAALGLLVEALGGGNAKIDLEQIRQIVRKEMEGIVLPVSVQIIKIDGQIQKLDGVHHHTFPELIKYVQSGNHVWLYGPKGTGKTKAVENAFTALGRKFLSDGITGEEHKILGYMDAHGKYVRTNFRDAFEFGHGYLADEIDSWGNNALMALQSALANGYCAFPDGFIARHESFQFVGAANTAGYGATFEYCGRNRIDEAFLDRLVYLAWDLDETLELAISGNPDWTRYVQKVRKAVSAKGLKGLDVSPRASINGAKLLAAGVSWDNAAIAVLKRGMTAEQWQGVK